MTQLLAEEAKGVGRTISLDSTPWMMYKMESDEPSTDMSLL